MSTKREPLLSARLFDVLRSLDGNVAEWVTDDLLGIHDDLAKHEAARAKGKAHRRAEFTQAIKDRWNM